MVPTLKPLLRLTAGELMSHEVVVIPQEMSLQGAAKVLSRAQVSGGPVVNEDGRCVGVLSASDFLHWAEKGGRPSNRLKYEPCVSWSILDTGEAGEARVRDIMNRDPVMVSSNAQIGELARMMIDAHIHRVIVVDGQQRPVGIVSCTDLLGALSQADLVEE